MGSPFIPTRVFGILNQIKQPGLDMKIYLKGYMKVFLITAIAVCLSVNFGFGQIVDTKIIDNGGSGAYKAVAVIEKTLPDFVVYRPLDLKQAKKFEGSLPVVVWANGGCMDSSIHHERFLTEIASHGYVIVAIGTLQMTVEERGHKPTPDKKLQEGINWITQQVGDEKSQYYQTVDVDKMVAGGMSCGGAQVMAIASDKRLKGYMMFNSGMGDMTMAGASKSSLENLHHDIIYVAGGVTDIAYSNAILDYERIKKVPAVFTSLEKVGHGGTFDQEYGGSFAQIALDWLNWKFKEVDNSELFQKGDRSRYLGWTIKSKNF